MSNPSGPAQKNLSEEDSSGSDAGSEVSFGPVAAETDRFGFILTNGSTAGSVGPPPELVRQREAKWISIINQWDRVLMKKSSKVKVQCQKGIPASLRAKCWPLLCGATNRTKHNENLYRSLDSQPALQSWVDVIERDLDRQFPFHEMFLSRDGHGQRGLFRVLKAYTQYQPDEGYCQAQGPVAAVLLMNMPAEEAFWCLVQISEQYLPGYYSPLLEGVLFDAAMLTWVLKRTCPAAHKHLQRHGVEPLMFATDWLMCLFTRHLPFNTLLRVWDLFFCYGVRVLFQVAVVLVRLVLGRSEQRQECQGQMETLERLRSVREQVQQEDDAFIAEVCSIPLSGKDLEKQTEKELQKWRKDRPSSTFDPRGRCHGYRMVWARAREKEEEQDRREREKGNLSVPLVRSASTLSLSPSLLRKKWRKGGKVNAGEWEGGGKVVRNLSMGANEAGWERWADLNLKKVQSVEEEEDNVSDEHNEQSESKSTGQIEQEEVLEEPKELAEKHSEPTQHLEEREKLQVQEQTAQAEPEKAEKEESQGLTEVPSQQTHSLEEDRTAETEPIQDPAQFTENVCEQTEDASHNKQGVELECNSQSEILEQQSHNRNNQEMVNRESEEETVKLVAESEHVVATEEKETEIKRDADTDTNTDRETQATVDISEEPIAQADMKPEEETEIENVQQETIDTVTEIRMESELQISTEMGLSSQEDRDVEELSVINSDPATEMKTQQEQGEIKVTDRGSQADASEVGDQSTDQSAETEMKAQSHTQTEVNEPVEKQEKMELTTSTQREPETDAETGAETGIETSVPVETQERLELDTGTPKEPETDAETGTETNVPVETQEKVEFATGTLEEPETDTQTGTETSLAVEIQEKADFATGKVEEPETQTEEEEDTDLPKDGLSPKETNAEVENGSSNECIFQNKQTDLVVPTAMESMLNLTVCTETDSEIVAADSTPQTDEAFAESEREETEIVALQPTQAKEEIIVVTHTEVEEDKDANICDQTQTEETPETQTHMETTDCVTPPEETQTSTQPANLSSTIEPDGKTSLLETVIPEEPKSQVTISPVAEEERIENMEVEEAEVFIASPNQSVLSNVPQPVQKDECCTTDSPHIASNQDKNDSHSQMDQSDLSNPGLTQAAAGHRISTSSSDFRVRKSSSSRGHRLTRRLSEDLFTAPQQAAQTQSIPAVPDSQNKHAVLQSNSGTDTSQSEASSHQTKEDATLSQSKEETGSSEGTMALESGAKQEQRPPTGAPKRFGLFRRLRGEQPKQTKEKGAPKMQVPKILIQDFSDGVGKESPIAEEGEEKLSSKERRRRRRERERKEKEEVKLRKKREKEMEKEKGRERKKPQTRGKSFQVQRERGGDDVPHPANSSSQTLRYSASYAESYF